MMENKNKNTKKQNKSEIKKDNKKKTPKKVEVKEEKKVPTKKEVKKENKGTDSLYKVYEFFDKYQSVIYGAIGGILITSLVAVLIWPERIAKLKDGTEPVAKIEGYTVTADDLYTNMKAIYPITKLLDIIDANILEKKYPETDEIKDEAQEQADGYYKAYEQYYQMSKEDFLAQNGFKDEKEFLDYLKLQYRRTKYTEDYVKGKITEREINKYYEDKVYGDINTKHMLVKVDASASDEDKKEAEEKAKEIISKLDSGKTFDEVKEEYKDSITYEELGYKAYNASLEEAYMMAMQKLDNNSYSKTPVKTSYGYHIIYRIDQKEKPALKDITEDVKTAITNEKLAEDKNLSSKSLEEMRKDAGLEFKDTNLEKKYNDYKNN